MRLVATALVAAAVACLAGCAHHQKSAGKITPAQFVAEYVAPPQCVEVLSPLKLDLNGQVVRKQKVSFKVKCSEMVVVKK